MNNGLLIICFCCSVFSGILVLLLTSYYCKFNDRVDVLEKQIAHISITSAEFFCATNNRIADISTVVDTLDGNVDDLFFDVSDIKKKFDSPHLVYFSKRRDKNG